MLIVHSTSVRSFLDICLGKKVKATGAWAESAHDGLLYFYDVKKYMEAITVQMKMMHHLRRSFLSSSITV